MAAKKTKKKAKCTSVPVVEHERGCPGKAKRPARSSKARPRGGSATAAKRTATARGVGQSPTKKRAAKRPSAGQQSLFDRRSNPAGERAYARLHWGDEGEWEHIETSRVPDPRRGEPVLLGELTEVVYRTAKGRDGVADYEHRFGREKPLLVVTADGGLAIVGGSYRVETRGIVG